MQNHPIGTNRQDSFGQTKTSLIDRFGVWLSVRNIKKNLRYLNLPFKALDLGCGFHATLLQQIYPMIKKGTGIDIRINDAIKNDEKIVFIESTIENFIAHPTDEYDVIFMISVLEHLWEPQEVLDFCQSHLSNGGILMINVPTWLGKVFLEFSAFRLGFSPKIEMDDHKMYYDKKDLWPLLVRSGFKPSNIQMRYYKFGLNLFSIVRKG